VLSVNVNKTNVTTIEADDHQEHGANVLILLQRKSAQVGDSKQRNKTYKTDGRRRPKCDISVNIDKTNVTTIEADDHQEHGANVLILLQRMSAQVDDTKQRAKTYKFGALRCPKCDINVNVNNMNVTTAAAHRCPGRICAPVLLKRMSAHV
jgi:hypothetical protein